MLTFTFAYSIEALPMELRKRGMQFLNNKESALVLLCSIIFDRHL